MLPTNNAVMQRLWHGQNPGRVSGRYGGVPKFYGSLSRSFLSTQIPVHTAHAPSRARRVGRRVKNIHHHTDCDGQKWIKSYDQFDISTHHGPRRFISRGHCVLFHCTATQAPTDGPSRALPPPSRGDRPPRCCHLAVTSLLPQTERGSKCSRVPRHRSINQSLLPTGRPTDSYWAGPTTH